MRKARPSAAHTANSATNGATNGPANDPANGTGARSPADLPPADIDALYGLEPVFEPGQDSGTEPTCFVDIGCPSCGEHYAIEIDLTNGEFSHIEDCQVCCQPMQVRIELNDLQQLVQVTTQRLDEH